MRTRVTLYIEHSDSDDGIHEVESFADSVQHENRFSYPGLEFKDYMVEMNVSDDDWTEDWS